MHLLWINSKQFYQCSSMDDAKKKRGEFGGTILTPVACVDPDSWFYKNCKKQRRNKAKICQECPFREEVEKIMGESARQFSQSDRTDLAWAISCIQDTLNNPIENWRIHCTWLKEAVKICERIANELEEGYV